jgi:DNA repair exonuclease SbcCD ATPase subunit
MQAKDDNLKTLQSEFNNLERERDELTDQLQDLDIAMDQCRKLEEKIRDIEERCVGVPTLCYSKFSILCVTTDKPVTMTSMFKIWKGSHRC